MYSFRFRFAQWVMRHRRSGLVAFAALTFVFALGIRHVEIRTIFSDLLPTDDPFVQVYKDHPNFGNPLTVTVMVRNRHGDIYNARTLAKVWQLTRDIDLAPGVDHDQILSIATEKARYAEATATGVDMRPLMEDHVPATDEEIGQFRTRVDKSPGARRFLISGDARATLVNATFIEQRLDYGEAFKYVQGLVETARDADHDIYLAGQPALTGWVYHYESQMALIFAVTLGALVLALVLYMRNVVGVVTPIVTSAVAAIWGFGFVGWLRSPIEPLLMIVPLLLVARSFSHCVQFTERYYEIYSHVRDRAKAAEITMSVMMAPSVLGIFADFTAIFLIAIAPIPAMQRFALFCGFWAVWLVPTGVVLISLLLAELPAPGNIETIVGGERESGAHRIARRLLARIAAITHGPAARTTTVVVTLGLAFCLWHLARLDIGNPVEGSNLLWPVSEFNRAVAEINHSFPGVNTLEVVFEAKNPRGEDRSMRQADTILSMERMQALIEHEPEPPRATLSFGDYLMEANRLFSGGNPKWLPLDPTDTAVNAAAAAVMLGSSPKAFSHVIDFEQQNGTVSLWYGDNRQLTVDRALSQVRRAVAAIGADHKNFRVRMASGTIALQAAMNGVVQRYHWVILGLLNLVILIGCSLAYRSLVAGLILLVPVTMSNVVLGAALQLMGVGLDINSLLVAAIGVGVGIDYGIYLVSRICEEHPAHGHEWGRTLTAALTTTGKAILFTASIMVVGILPWYFLSGLKFMADMGLLLVLLMVINMVLALVVLPLLVWLVKPRFVSRDDLLIGEGVDLSDYVVEDEALEKIS